MVNHYTNIVFTFLIFRKIIKGFLCSLCFQGQTDCNDGPVGFETPQRFKQESQSDPAVLLSNFGMSTTLSFSFLISSTEAGTVT